MVGAGGCGGVVVVGIYVQKGIPEGAFVGLVPEDAVGEDVVLDSGCGVHRMGAGCGVYYGLESLLVGELVRVNLSPYPFPILLRSMVSKAFPTLVFT